MMGFVEPLTGASEAVDAPTVTRRPPFKGVEGTENKGLKVRKVYGEDGVEIEDRSGMKGVHYSLADMIKEAEKDKPVRRTQWKRVNGAAVQVTKKGEADERSNNITKTIWKQMKAEMNRSHIERVADPILPKTD